MPDIGSFPVDPVYQCLNFESIIAIYNIPANIDKVLMVAEKGRRTIFGADFEIFVLGIVSFLTDVSSEMIFAVLSIFLTVVLGASAIILGLMEGLADFASSSLDFLSGYFSDKTGRRKIFALSGYTFSTAAKAFLVFATSVISVMIFRIIERLGKSIRGPPRDALISSISSSEKRGFSFGLHKAMDKFGAILGPLIAYFLLERFGQTAETFRLIFIIAVVPALLSVIVMALFVKDRPEKKQPKMEILTTYESLGSGYKHFLKSAGIFSLAYFSFAFLLLKSYLAGFEIKDVALLYALFNIVFVIVSIPIGRLGDKIGRKWIIILSYLIYGTMSVGFIFASTKPAVILMFVLYGIFYAIDDAQIKAYITDLSDKESRATAIGIYNFVTGLIYLPASLIAGALWSYAGPAYTFGFAALMTVVGGSYFLFGGTCVISEDCVKS
jgi:MFS family permease